MRGGADLASRNLDRSDSELDSGSDLRGIREPDDHDIQGCQFRASDADRRSQRAGMSQERPESPSFTSNPWAGRRSGPVGTPATSRSCGCRNHLRALGLGPADKKSRAKRQIDFSAGTVASSGHDIPRSGPNSRQHSRSSVICWTLATSTRGVLIGGGLCICSRVTGACRGRSWTPGTRAG